MARVWFGGFETRNANTEVGLVTGTPALETSIFRSGSAAMRCSGVTNQSLAHAFTGSLNTTYFLRSYIYVTTYPTQGLRDLVRFAGGGTPQAAISLNTSGELRLCFLPSGSGGGGTQVGSLTSALSLNTWYRIELGLRITSGATDEIYGSLDGVSFASATAQTISNTAPDGASVGQTALALDVSDVVFDDWVLDNSTSTGDSKVVMLSPTADNAVGSGWVLGTGTAFGGNGFAAVDNEPPVGVADLAGGSDPKQIRNATSAANSNYDATLETYTAAGVAGTVNAVQGVISTAAPVTTSSKQGTVGVVSNPTITNIALAAGGTSGAFWSGVAAGTFPTGWKTSRTTLSASPSVTLGTAPVMRITQVTSSTRIAMVCYMGLYVEYTPAADLTLKSTQMHQLLAH